ncbi:NAD(P)/FAD-dependent oxidoreductase [Nocardioides sp. LHD-245]|uniref:FAD-dependent oxidoreductase n=1 Tax=Nocardioides sp. LHD-245 TaxID=3051387 RepID=UPI0027DF088D|nr:NAD(P)/FAD-dependent oxidoreductase [Nocardioides sp. LHD-245]
MADRGESVAIVGAGLAGCLLAALLGRRGIEVTLYERRADPRTAEPERGRSINLAISARGLAALDEVGLKDDALARALPMHGRMVHTPTGEQSSRPYSADGTRPIHSISRSELNLALLEEAAKTPGVELRFGYRLRSADLDSGVLAFDTPAGAEEVRASIVLAADGAFSAARRAVTFRTGFNFSQDYLEHGYKELTIPPTADGEFAMSPDALHIWPRGGSMMIALPNMDRSFTCTLFWTRAEFDALVSDEQIVDHFAARYPDVVGLAPDLVDDYRHNPIGSLATIRSYPWVHRGERATLALVGDAAHAIVPFFGQGANCAFEDCIEIDRSLAEHDGDWRRALDAYQQRRKANCDAIAEMALDNFVEMRDRVNSPVFQAKTQAEHWLERTLPGRFVSRYELVSFTTVPYAEIPARVGRQRLVTAVATAGVLAANAARSLLPHREDHR